MQQLNLFVLMASPNGQQSPMFTMVMMGGIFLVFWLFMIRPQAKKAKEQKKFIENLQKGDKIVTIAGIHGIVSKINEDGTLQIEVNPGTYFKIEKSSISQEWTAGVNKATTATK